MRSGRRGGRPPGAPAPLAVVPPSAARAPPALPPVRDEAQPAPPRGAGRPPWMLAPRWAPPVPPPSRAGPEGAGRPHAPSGGLPWPPPRAPAAPWPGSTAHQRQPPSRALRRRRPSLASSPSLPGWALGMATPTRERRVEEEDAAPTATAASAAAVPTARSTSRPRPDGSHPAEERFERRRRTVGLFLGPLLFALVLLIPFDLEPNQHRLAAILALVVAWWVTEAIPIPVTALVGVALVALLEATPPPTGGRGRHRHRLRHVLGRHGLPVHRQLHHRRGDGRARAAPAARLPGALAEGRRRLDLPDHPRVRADRRAHLAGDVEHGRRGDDAADRARRHGRGGRHGRQPAAGEQRGRAAAASAPR